MRVLGLGIGLVFGRVRVLRRVLVIVLGGAYFVLHWFNLEFLLGLGLGSEVGFVVNGGHKWVMWLRDSVAEGEDRGAASGLWLKGRLCSMLTMMLGRDLHVATLG